MKATLLKLLKRAQSIEMWIDPEGPTSSRHVVAVWDGSGLDNYYGRTLGEAIRKAEAGTPLEVTE